MKTIKFLPSIVLCLSFLVVISSQTQQPAKGIRFFDGSWQEAVTKAKAEQKYIFLDAYASWCGPCKTMDREVYTDAAVAAYINKKFIAVKIDMEKAEGPGLAKRLPSIDGYPSLLFFNSDGHLSKTILGSRSAKDFLAEAKLVGK